MKKWKLNSMKAVPSGVLAPFCQERPPKNLTWGVLFPSIFIKSLLACYTIYTTILIPGVQILIYEVMWHMSHDKLRNRGISGGRIFETFLKTRAILLRFIIYNFSCSFGLSSHPKKTLLRPLKTLAGGGPPPRTPLFVPTCNGLYPKEVKVNYN